MVWYNNLNQIKKKHFINHNKNIMVIAHVNVNILVLASYCCELLLCVC